MNFQNIKNLPKSLLFSITVLLVGLLGFLDYITGQDFTFYIFYVIPVFFCVWYLGRWQGILISFLCLASWVIDSIAGRPEHMATMLLNWNLAVQQSFFIILVLILSFLRNSIEKQRELEKQKSRRELEIAKQVQQKLFPQNMPVIPSAEYYGACRPADEIGGDYYDYFLLNKESIAFVVGDISGHGLPSALLMASLVGYVRSNAGFYEKDCAQLVKSVNTSFCEATGQANFATFFYSIYNNSTGLLTYVNAGQNPPLLFTKQSGFESSRLMTGGLMIGMLEGLDFDTGTVNLNHGDYVLFYTDGITEAMNSKDEFFGEEKLTEILKNNAGASARKICEEIFNEVDIFSNGIQQADDMTVLVVRAV